MDRVGDPLLAELRRECAELSNDLEKIATDCSQCQPIAAGETTPLQVLAYQEQKLKAELQLRSEQPLESMVRTTRVPVINAILLDELRRTNRELEESLVALRQRKRESEAELEKLSQHLDEFRKVHEHLEAQSSQTESVNSEDTSLRHQQAIAEKREKTKDYYSSVSKEMEAFISQHFRSPDEEQPRSKTRGPDKQRRKVLRQSTLEDMSRKAGKQYKSITEMIDVLADMWLESAHHPYKVIPDDFWPPYTRLLLTAGIARLNPYNSNQIQLVPCFK